MPDYFVCTHTHERKRAEKAERMLGDTTDKLIETEGERDGAYDAIREHNKLHRDNAEHIVELEGDLDAMTYAYDVMEIRVREAEA